MNTLISNQAIMPVFQADGNSAMNTFANNYNGNGVSAVLWESEIDPSQTGYWGADATVEEVLHTINGVGHVNLYPSAFGLSPNSSLLSEAMDIARGGQFTSIPNPYPATAWYHYDDYTCDYQCMAIEYLYWMIVSNMGILNDISTCNGIANEWELCSPTLLQTTDILGYDLITDSTYRLPQLAPDGNYWPANYSSIYESINDKVKIYPNPANDKIMLKLNKEIYVREIELIDIAGKQLYIHSINEITKQLSFNISNLSRGMYLIKVITLEDDIIMQWVK